jgi:hypothetical protein
MIQPVKGNDGATSSSPEGAMLGRVKDVSKCKGDGGPFDGIGSGFVTRGGVFVKEYIVLEG